jgi:hypothetical protein
VVGEPELEVGEIRGLFHPFLADAGRRDEVLFCRLALLHDRGLHVVEYEAHDLVCIGRMQNFLPSSRCR